MYLPGSIAVIYVLHAAFAIAACGIKGCVDGQAFLLRVCAYGGVLPLQSTGAQSKES